MKLEISTNRYTGENTHQIITCYDVREAARADRHSLPPAIIEYSHERSEWVVWSADWAAWASVYQSAVYTPKKHWFKDFQQALDFAGKILEEL